MTEEIDISKCICIYTNSKNINQWLKKSILVSVYVYTLNSKKYKSMTEEIDISKLYVYTPIRVKNINQWLKKSIL
jgi:ssDNA-specific exonuclease RecJ